MIIWQIFKDWRVTAWSVNLLPFLLVKYEFVLTYTLESIGNICITFSMSELKFFRLLLNEDALWTFLTENNLLLTSQIAAEKNIRCRNPRCRQSNKGFKDSTRARNIQDAKAEILSEQGENILTLMCLRCTSCWTYLSPRTRGKLSYYKIIQIKILRVSYIHGPAREVEHEAISVQSAPNRLALDMRAYWWANGKIDRDPTKYGRWLVQLLPWGLPDSQQAILGCS